MRTIRLYAPDGTIGGEAVSLAAAPELLTGLRLAVLDNGKPGADRLLARAAERIAQRTGALPVAARRKGSAATPCEPELLAELVASADLVLTGTAD